MIMECNSAAESECPSPWNLEKLKEELSRGQQLAYQLGSVVENDSGISAAQGAHLTTMISDSFTNSLSILNGINPDSSEDQLNISDMIQASIITHADSPSHKLAHKGRRGTHKERETSHSWIRETPDFTDDGHAWRKYGQKQILNAPHPRSYYRCSHKFDQGCIATKQVQKVQGNPPLFRTTYYENHTCTISLLKSPELVLDSIISFGVPSPGQDQSINSTPMITFDNPNNFTNTQERHFFSSTNEELSNSNHIPINQLSPNRQQAVLGLPGVTRGFPSNPQAPELGHEDGEFIYKRMMGYLFDDDSFPYEL